MPSSALGLLLGPIGWLVVGLGPDYKAMKDDSGYETPESSAPDRPRIVLIARTTCGSRNALAIEARFSRLRCELFLPITLPLKNLRASVPDEQVS